MGFVKVTKKRVGADESESGLLKSVLDYFAYALPPEAVFTTFPLGGFHGARMTMRGTMIGFPDLLIFWNARTIAIELKTKTGVVGPEQRASIARLQTARIPTAVCRSLIEVVQFLHENAIPARRIAA